MHLARGLTTTNTKKRKRKITKAKMAKWAEELRLHNKQMKRLGMKDHIMTMEEYVDYVHGQFKPKRESKGAITTPWHHTEPYVRESPTIPSLSSNDRVVPATKKEPLQYTGERKLVGIATMHKSNMVPVFADDDDKTGKKQATEIATMRRN